MRNDDARQVRMLLPAKALSRDGEPKVQRDCFCRTCPQSFIHTSFSVHWSSHDDADMPWHHLNGHRNAEEVQRSAKILPNLHNQHQL